MSPFPGQTHEKKSVHLNVNNAHLHKGYRVPQGSVQIELIFRLLLKITVDWPYNAILKCL